MSHIIGIDLGGTNIKGALFTQSGELLVQERCPTEAQFGSGHVLRRISRVIELLLERACTTQDDILCLGIGVPGLLDPETGVSFLSPNFPDWDHVPVAQLLSRSFSFPVYIDNDARVNLYGEWMYGAGRGARNMIVLTLGTGLGSGVMVNGKVLYGAADSAGEIGHMNIVRTGGRPCRCGSTGCLGRYVSARGTVRTFVEALDMGRTSIVTDWVEGDFDRIEAVMLSKAYDLGDALAIEVMHRSGELLGFALAGVINLLGPERVIIGGGMSAAGERLLGTVRKTIRAHVLERAGAACEVLPAALGDAAGMYGAAAYAQLRQAGQWKGETVNHPPSGFQRK